MLAVILKILSVIGIILLVILGIILVLLLLVLFFPVFYRIHGKKDSQNFFISIKANWLSGLVRVRCIYPEPGNITAKILFFKVFDSAAEKRSDESADKDVSKEKAVENQNDSRINYNGDIINNDVPGKDNSVKDIADKDTAENSYNEKSEQAVVEDDEGRNTEKKNIFSGLSSKYKKIEYTIQKICDKIKEIWENIDFYKKLLEEENTKALFKHAFNRLCRILKSVRPRKLKADIIFGAATPDITGYVYGIYTMACSSLGRNFYLEPDFSRQVLEGELSASGHITVFTVMFNAAMIIFDRKLKILRMKLKNHSPQKE